MTFHEKFAKLCKIKGLSNQRSLADTLEVSKSTLNRWLSGESMPDIGEGHRIAALLGVSLDYLADDAQDDPPSVSRSGRHEAIAHLIGEMGEAEALRRLAKVEDANQAVLEPVVIRPGQKPPGESRKGAG